jgi:hypothetical protein
MSELEDDETPAPASTSGVGRIVMQGTRAPEFDGTWRFRIAEAAAHKRMNHPDLHDRRRGM